MLYKKAIGNRCFERQITQRKAGKLSQGNMGMLVKGNTFSRRKILLLQRNIVDLLLCTHFLAKILYSRFNQFFKITLLFMQIL